MAEKIFPAGQTTQLAFRRADIGNSDGILPHMQRNGQGAPEDTIVLLSLRLMANHIIILTQRGKISLL